MTDSRRNSTALRFPPDLYEELALAAQERGLSINRLVVEAVRDFLPRLIPVEEWKLTR